MVNSTQIRASSGAIIQQHPANVQIQSHPPALHPVSQNTYTPGGAQVGRKYFQFYYVAQLPSNDINFIELPL